MKSLTGAGTGCDSDVLAGESGGIKAARMGHDVIMTPGGYCYFDSYQADPRTQPAAIGGFLPYLKVYSYYPVPEELTPEEENIFLGHRQMCGRNIFRQHPMPSI